MKKDKRSTWVTMLLVFLVVCFVVCAGCATSSAPSKPQYPKLADDYQGKLSSDSALRPQLLTLTGVDQASDGGFIAILIIFDVSSLTQTSYDVLGHTKPFVGGKAQFSMQALASNGELNFTGTVSQQTGEISGTVALNDGSNTTATWTLTPSSAPTPSPTTSS